MKIKIRETTTLEKEIEITLPAYFENGILKYMLISEDHCITVCTPTISKYKAIEERTSIPNNLLQLNPITKEEFMAAYNKVKDYFNNQIT